MASKQQKTSGLLLRRFLHRDSSLIVHAFTREQGRVHLLARGARRGGKKPPVPLVPLVQLELIWLPNQRSELQLLREWSLEEGFGPLHISFDKMAWGQAALETLGRTLTGEEPHSGLFDETIDYLHAIAEERARPESLFARYRLIALRELGYGLDLKLPEKARGDVGFVAEQGAFVANANEGIGISLGAARSLAAIEEATSEEMARIRLVGETLTQMNAVLDAAYRQSFERWRPLESLRLLTAPMMQAGRPTTRSEGESA